MCENYHRTKCKFTANCTVQKIPAKTTHASASKARQEIDFVVLSVCHGITQGAGTAAGSRATRRVGPYGDFSDFAL